MEPDKVAPIAIIGINLKFPGEAVSPQAFWELMHSKKNVAKEVPSSRFNIDAFYHPDPARLDSIRIRAAHFMEEDPRSFDAPFFNISPAEASVMDAQQRGLLEGAYRTFENAGIPMEAVAGSNTSVFAASFVRDHEAITARDFEYQSPYQATGSGSSMLSNRLSHFFDLSGPSLTVDTACSSGLYAFHLGCQSLLRGESTMSLVCGSNTFLTPECQALALSNGGFLSPDGCSYSFDHKANGYGRGEGYGFLLLKPLDLALRDGDVVRAVVRASGANQDGKTPVITQPSPQAQMDLIKRTYEVAGLSRSETDYVEAHGTGTPVGDPIEAAAIGEAFRGQGDRAVWIGSVKSNIGHLEGASGIAGVIKSVLALEKAVIPPIANFDQANPAIDTAALQIRFPAAPVPWPVPPSGVRRASVSSFGYGGSNAHVILDDAGNYLRKRGLRGLYRSADGRSLLSTGADEDDQTATPPQEPAEPVSVLLPFSAGDQRGPQRQAEALEGFLATLPREAQTPAYLADLAYTLSTRRSRLKFRSFALGTSVPDMALPGGLAGALAPSVLSVSSNVPALAFVFTGQGAQYAGMGCRLAAAYPVVRESLAACDAYLRTLGSDWSVLEELARARDAGSRIGEPAWAQPLCTAIQVALVDLLRSWGVVPAAVCGHSSGEVAAAYCAGGLDRQSAWKVAYVRGLVASKQVADPRRVPTTMMSVGLGPEAVKGYLADAPAVSVACVNSPGNVTLSGPVAVLDDLFARLDEREIFARKLPVPIGYHSEALRDGAPEYLAAIKGIQGPAEELPRPVQFYSSTRGCLMDLEPLRTAEYWVENLLSPVLFSTAVAAMVGGDKKPAASGRHFVVEIGPQSALRRPVKDSLEPVLGPENGTWRFASALQGTKQDEARAVLESVGHLWSSGMDIDLAKANEAAQGPASRRTPRPLVDLPAYPFSRAELYWDESRLSRAYSSRPFRRHGLLGIRDRDWNAAEAAWRHPIRYAENPWILDHALNKSAIYPGSGMLVMAIEAVRQLAGAELEERTSGYKLENVRFLHSIPVNDSEHGVEAKIYLRPRRSTTAAAGDRAAATTWYDWRVFGNEGDEWHECAYGSIQLELLGAADDAADAARRGRFAAAAAGQRAEDARQCSLGVDHAQLYQNLARKSGFDFGPYFQTLRGVRYDREGHASATLRARAYATTLPFAGEDPCVVHPTALDGVFHLGFVSLSMGGWQAIPTLMFTHLRELWVSHRLFRAGGNPTLQVAARETARTLREFEWDVAAVFADEDGGGPAVVARGERGTIVARGRAAGADAGGADADAQDVSAEDGAARLSYGIDFQPDLALLSAAETQAHLARTFAGDAAFSPPPAEVVDRGDAIALHFIEAVLARIDREGPATFDKHLTRYVDFLRRIRRDRDQYTLASRGLGHLAIDDVLAEADLEPTQRLVKKAGEHLYQILTGAENALQIVFEGHLADDFYNSDVWSRNYRKVGAYINMLAHANPQLRILEVGAGTGSSTGKIIPFLVDEAEEEEGAAMVRFGEYAYTDVSAAFFERARERFRHVEKHMRFARLDLEQDPTQQGFAEGTYDVIMAGNCLHTVSDVVQTSRWLRRLLRPGGKLILAETTVLDNIRDAIIFGLLPGWWMRDGHWWSERGEEYRHDLDQGPILTEKQWGVVLREAGFAGGVEMVFRDHEEKPHHRVSLLVTTAPPEPRPDDNDGDAEAWTLLLDPASPAQATFAAALREGLAAVPWAAPPAVLTLDEAAADGWEATDETRIVSLLELDQGVLGHITAENAQAFAAIKKASTGAKYVLWLTCGGGPAAQNPAADLAVGFGRAVCSERGDQSFVTLSLEDAAAPAANVAHVVRVLAEIHRRRGGHPTEPESEYAVKDGLVHIPRIVPQRALNQAVGRAARTPAPVSYTFGAADAAKPHFQLTIEQPGLLDTLYYAEADPAVTEAPLAAGEVEIEVRAASLNFKDVMIALGQVPGAGFGLDGAGVVTAVGPGCALRPGDAVLYFHSGGCVGTRVRTPELSTERVPAGMAWHAAATVPTVWSTVVYALDWVARLGAGDTLLVHAGAGAVGQAAIQLARLRGLGAGDIYATVGSAAKRQLLREAYGLADDHILHSRDASFAADLLHATGGRGVDVVLNSLGGELLQQSWRCVAPFGRFLDIGKADILANHALPMGPFQKNVSFAAVDISLMYQDDQPRFKRLLRDVVALFDRHPQLKTDGTPRPLTVVPPSRVEEPLRALQAGRMAGKAVVDFGAGAAGDTVTYRPARRAAYRLGGAAEATYLISGGLGGLGRETVKWMLGRGARNFVLLSSKGEAGRPDAADFLAGVRAQGAVVAAPACDIADRAALAAVLASPAVRALPPIRGCIQAAMVLADDMLAKMTAAQFARALAPKVQGSQNLHALLPRAGLDFLVFLSSMSGVIGNPAQCNYAAGNTFEDALARTRAAGGLPGVAFDLTLILEAGWANDNFADVTRTLRAGLGGMTIPQVTSILDVLCDPAYDNRARAGLGAQVINVHDRPAHLYRLWQDGRLHWLGKPLMRHLLRLGQADAAAVAGRGGRGAGAGGDADAAAAVDHIALLLEAHAAAAAGDAHAGLAAAGHVVVAALLAKLSKSLSLEPEAVDVGQPAYAVGVDSLIAVELRYWFLKTFGVEVPVFQILKKQSVAELCRGVATLVLAAAAKA